MRTGFFIFFFAIVVSLNSYVMLRGWQSLPPLSFWRPLYLTGMILLFLALLVGMIFGSSLPHVPGKVISLIGFSYMIIFVYFFFGFLLVDLVRVLNHFLHFAPVGMHSFREWSFLFIAVITFVLMGIGNYRFNHPEIIHLNLTVDRPLQHKTVRIVAVSDIHLGVTIDKGLFKKYVELINEQHPDLVLIGGDFSDRLMKPVIDQHMDEEIHQIKAPMGIFAINGNHEFYAETPHATADYLTKAGVHDLRDQVAIVDSSFYIIGRDDRTNHNRKPLSELVKNLNGSLPRILLDHQPFHLEDAEQNGIDFQFSGHTHNGQFFPGNFFVSRMYELGYGYLKKGKTHYYVSSGLGLWGPQFRIGSHSELVVIDLNY